MSKLPARGEQPPQPPSAVSSVRGAIDSLVQGSLVELFNAYDVAVAPLSRHAHHLEPQPSDISATLTFTRDSGQTGRVTLSVPGPLLILMRGEVGSTLQKDWAKELTNQLVGRIKNRLLQFSVCIQIGALATIDSTVLARQLTASSSTRSYAGRTIRGEVVVTIQGMPEESELRFVGAASMAEGDLILF